MRLVVQRVTEASVSVAGREVGAIQAGLLVLVGIGPEDDEATADALGAKVAALRIFTENDGKMNLSVLDVGGAVLAISQFTLYGDARRGNRPSFSGAAPPLLAEPLYERFCDAIETAGVRCARGVFGAHMTVAVVNDGPVTLILDSDELKRARKA